MFQNRTPASLYGELLEDLHVRKRELQDELNEATGLERHKLVEALAELDKALAVGDEGDAMVTGDTLVDAWERDIEAGRMPDLNAGLPARRRT